MLDNFKVTMCCIHIHLQHHNDTTIKTDAWRKTQWQKCRKTCLQIFLPLTLLQGFERVVQGFACERMLETEHKLHILTPLLWPSRCVFLVLLILGSTPSGLSEGPLGWVWLSLPHLVSGILLATALAPNSTQLYNNSTPSRSPTGSLKSNV